MVNILCKYHFFIVNTRILYAVVALMMVFGARVSGKDTTYHSDEYGYRVEIPEGWITVPDKDLESIFTEVLKSETKTLYDVGFQSSFDVHWLEYPYVLVQVIDYKNNGMNRQPYDSELIGIVKAMSGVDLDEAIKTEMTDDLALLMQNPQLNLPILDKEKRVYRFDMSMQVDGIGLVRGRSVGYFGRDSIVQVCYYDLAETWKALDVKRSSILGSLQFDSDRVFIPSEPTIFERINNSAILRGALMGALIGAMTGCLLWVVRKFRKPQSV